MSQSNIDASALSAALGEIFARLRDVSLRDGIQSWDVTE